MHRADWVAELILISTHWESQGGENSSGLGICTLFISDRGLNYYFVEGCMCSFTADNRKILYLYAEEVSWLHPMQCRHNGQVGEGQVTCNYEFDKDVCTCKLLH